MVGIFHIESEGIHSIHIVHDLLYPEFPSFQWDRYPRWNMVVVSIHHILRCPDRSIRGNQTGDHICFGYGDRHAMVLFHHGWLSGDDIYAEHNRIGGNRLNFSFPTKEPAWCMFVRLYAFAFVISMVGAMFIIVIMAWITPGHALELRFDTLGEMTVEFLWVITGLIALFVTQFHPRFRRSYNG